MKTNSPDNVGFVVSVDNGTVANDTRDEQMSKKSTTSDSENGSSLYAERLALIKKRIAAKFYDQEEILQEIAGRILQRQKNASSRDTYGDKNKS